MPGALQAAPFIALGLVLVTLPHHWRVRNLGTLSIIAWLSLYNLIYGIDAFIWNGNVEIRALVWCDIVTKFKIGADVGLPGCCLCLAKRLNRIAYGLEMSAKGWRHRTLDILLCWGFPMIVMALHYIVQGHRFDIIENIGCIPAIYISWPSVIILDLSGFIPAVLALLYCGLALLKLYKRRVAFRIALKMPDSSLTPSRYARLIIMTFFLGTWNTVLISISASNEYTTGLQPWTNWSYVHEDFSFVGQFPSATFPTPALRCIYIVWWAVPLSSLSFFVFFGVGEDAMKDYRASVDWVRRDIFRRNPKRVASSVDVVSEDVHSLPPHIRNRPLPPIPYDVQTYNEV